MIKPHAATKKTTPGLKAWNASTVYNIGKQVHLCPEKKKMEKDLFKLQALKIS